ncbi:MAG: phage integrase SAM-like domain-containing protein [Alistipes sp.]
MARLFKVLFCKGGTKNGKVPVMGRITVNGRSRSLAVVNVRPALWDTEANKASGKSVEAQRINEKLENIKTNIGKQYQRICDRDSYVTAEKVKNAWLGMGGECKLLLQTFDEYLVAFEKRVGKDRSPSTLENIQRARKYLAEFLEEEYHLSDIPFGELKGEFIEEFAVFLSNKRNLMSGTIETPVGKLHRMTYTAVKNGWIAADPFAGYKYKVVHRDRRFLTETELQAVMKVYVPNYKTAIVRDIFVFCCFTGMAYSDVKKLTHADIHTDGNGEMWIIDNRAKTGTQFRVKLLPVARQLVERYSRLSLPAAWCFPSRTIIDEHVPALCGPARRTVILSHHPHRAAYVRDDRNALAGRSA